MNRYKAPIIIKAFSMLNLISKKRGNLRLSDIAREMDFSKSTVHGILTALEEVGAVIRDPDTKKYSLGLTILELGTGVTFGTEIKKAAGASLRKIADSSSESVFLGIRNRDHVTVIDLIESNHQLKVTSFPGARLPLLAGAVGKAFLSFMQEGEILSYISEKGLPAFTPRSITDKKEFMDAVMEVKRTGVAFDDEEFMMGVRAVAAPIGGNPGLPSAIWVVGFSSRLSREKLKDISCLIRKEAESIARHLCFPGTANH